VKDLCPRRRQYISLCKEPELVFQEGSPLSRLVLERCPALLQPYRPCFWATNAHVQTMLCGAPVTRQPLWQPCVAGHKALLPKY
jgi:hypothetical protein